MRSISIRNRTSWKWTVIATVAAVACAFGTEAWSQHRPLPSENFNRWPQYLNTTPRHMRDYWQWHDLQQGRAIHSARSSSWESEWYLRRNWSYDPSGRRYRAREVQPPPSTIHLPRRSTLQGTGTRPVR